MVALPQTFKTEEVKTTPNTNVYVPDGDYKVVIVNSAFEQSPYSSSDPQGIMLTVVITEGQHANTEFKQFLAVSDETPINASKPTFTRAVAAIGTLGQIANALGIAEFGNTDVFHNKPLYATTGTSKGKDKDTGAHKPEWDKSYIKSYKALPANGVVAQPASEAPVTTQEAAPATVDAPASNPFAS